LKNKAKLDEECSRESGRRGDKDDEDGIVAAEIDEQLVRQFRCYFNIFLTAT
jgi:hypothetical protein